MVWLISPVNIEIVTMTSELAPVTGLPLSDDLYPVVVITPKHIRSARIWLDWDQADLARESGVSLSTIGDIERGVSDTRIGTLSEQSPGGGGTKSAPEIAGVQFLDPGDNGSPGVRLKPAKRKR